MPLERRLSDPAPAFVGRMRGGATHVIPVRHYAGPPADHASVALIPTDVPGSKEAADFYRLHDGAILFYGREDGGPEGPEVEGDASALQIFSLTSWPAMIADQRGLWAAWMREEADALLYGRDDVIPIAHLWGAANYVHWVVRGPHAGEVHWWPWTMPPWKGEASEPLAASFDAFLELICGDPVKLLWEQLGGYAQYPFPGEPEELTFMPKRP